MYHYLIEPFLEFSFLGRALFSSLLMAAVAPTIGLFLNFRNMSLIGDALSHALLPGVALAYLIAGITPFAIIFGGVFSGLLLFLIARFFGPRGPISSNASSASGGNSTESRNLAPLFVISTGIGVLILSINGSISDLHHLMFGSILTIGKEALFLQVFLTGLIGFGLIFFSRFFLLSFFDTEFFYQNHPLGKFLEFLFISIVLLALVSSLFLMGSLLALGVMIIPAAIARGRFLSFKSMCFFSTIIAVLSVYLGLVVSFHFDLPTGPTITGMLGVIYLVINFWDFFRTPKIDTGKNLSTFFLVAAFSLVIFHTQSAFLNAKNLNPKKPFELCTSNFILKSLVETAIKNETIINGDIAVKSLTPEGSDFHHTAASPSLIKAIHNCNTVVYIGGSIDSWVSKILKEKENLKAIAISDSQLLLKNGKSLDPHFWHHPTILIEVLKFIASKLEKETEIKVALDPIKMKAFELSLKNLFEKQKREFDLLAKSKKELAIATSHPVFFYMGEAYNIKIFSALASSADSSGDFHFDESVKSISQFVKNTKQHHVEWIFPDHSHPHSFASQLSKDSGLKLGEPLASESFKLESSKIIDFVLMHESNTNTILKSIKN